ncbi:hypothetical protein [Nocardioides aquiterrae]|uniref:Uncharacterized protein n=1 Tax=Nocardioides aquiterrae TaxID=203799 RepID=A0ABN1USG2_9ACTN
MTNETETITIDSVTIDSVTTVSRTNPDYRHLRITGLETRTGGSWQPVTRRETLQLRAGTTQQVRVVMRSAVLGTRYQRLALTVPASAAGGSGQLSISGGDDVYAEAPYGATIDQMLAFFERQPRNDQVLTRLSVSGMPAVTARLSRQATVGGAYDVQVEVTG